MNSPASQSGDCGFEFRRDHMTTSGEMNLEQAQQVRDEGIAATARLRKMYAMILAEAYHPDSGASNDKLLSGLKAEIDSLSEPVKHYVILHLLASTPRG